MKTTIFLIGVIVQGAAILPTNLALAFYIWFIGTLLAIGAYCWKPKTKPSTAQTPRISTPKIPGLTVRDAKAEPNKWCSCHFCNPKAYPIPGNPAASFSKSESC